MLYAVCMRGLFGAIAIGLSAVGLTSEAQTSNPFPNPILSNPIILDVATFARIPSPATVNQLVTSPDGRIFVCDQLRGHIYLVSADGKTVNLYLNVSGTSSLEGLGGESPEDGLESLSFHPDFLKAGAKGYGKFYTVHTESPYDLNSSTYPYPFKPADFPFNLAGATREMDYVVLEWQVADPMASAFTPADPSAPYRELLRIGAPDFNHTMGLAAFNPTAPSGSSDYGKLYIGVGDGGSEGDPWHLGQDKTQPYSKILRIDPLGTNGRNGRYGIPADNPFVGVDGELPETWALGFRNPQRYVWDTGDTHQMYIADIGQGTVEEIDLGLAGANYGWSQREGSFVYNGYSNVGAYTRSDSAVTGFTYPIAEYDHSEGISITTGPVYRGTDIPALQGKLIFGDIAKGRVFCINTNPLPDGGQAPITELRLRFDGVERTMLQEVGNPTRVDLRFGTDQAGHIFLLNKHDNIVRIVVGSNLEPTPTPSPTPISTSSPTSSPAPPASPSVLRDVGQPIHVTEASRITLHGTSGGDIVTVQWRLSPSSHYRSASNPVSWKFTIPLRLGRNVILLRAIHANGTVTLIRRVIARN